MIEIDIGPYMFSSGSFVLSWHGFFSFVAVATAVFLVGRWARFRGVLADDIYTIAMWAIVGGVLGARLVHVVDHWGRFYQDNPVQIIAVWEGGIGLWGGILGGFIGGVVATVIMNRLRAGRRARLERRLRQARDDGERAELEEEIGRSRHLPIGAIADLTAPAMLFVQTIGRLGDIVNGEHCAKALDMFFGFVWTNPDSAARSCDNGVGVSVHPVIAYEMIWNLLSLVVIWRLRGRLRPDGMLFALYLALYSAGRFAITFAREDRVWSLGLQEAQYIAIIVLLITVPLLVVKGRWTGTGEIAAEPASPPRQTGTRAERRRRGLGR